MADRAIVTPETVVWTSRHSEAELRSETVSAALTAFFGDLPLEELPFEDSVEAASERTRLVLGDRLLSEEWLRPISGDVPTAANLSALRMSFESAAAPLSLPLPQCTSVLPPKRIAAAAAAGALAGLVLLSPLSLLILGSRDAGILVGPPLGAFVLVLLADLASRSKRLKRVELRAENGPILMS